MPDESQKSMSRWLLVGVLAVIVFAMYPMVWISFYELTHEPEPPVPAPVPSVEAASDVDIRVVLFEEMIFERKMGIDGVWAHCTTNAKTMRIDCIGNTEDRKEVAYSCTEQGCTWSSERKAP